jgi:hypothetical protein
MIELTLTPSLMAMYPDFPASVQKSIRSAIVPVIQAIPTGSEEDGDADEQLEQLSQLNILLLDNYEGSDTLSLRILQVLASDKGNISPSEKITLKSIKASYHQW